MTSSFRQSKYHRNSTYISRIGLIAILILGAFSYWSASEYQLATGWREHTDQVIAAIRGLDLSLQAAESAQRGYVITHQTDFINTYHKAHDGLAPQLEALKALVIDNPEQLKRYAILENLVLAKTSVLDQGLALATAGHAREVAELVAQKRSIMVQVRAVLHQMESEEIQLWKTRSARAQQTFHQTSLTVLLGLLTAFGLLYLAHRLLDQEVRLRHTIENDLKEATQKALDASNLKSTFLANMSHEIRTPLNGIIGMSKLLEQTELNERQDDYVQTIKTSSHALLALINQILDISKIESGKLQLEEAHFELASLLRSTLSIVDFAAKSKGLQMMAEIAPDVPEFFVGDPLRLRQVTLNLLNNAIKFSERGAIRIRVTKTDEIDGYTCLLFEIIDQGIGFDHATKEKIFTTFSQGDDSTSRRYGGTGLGLSISRQIVEMMGGNLDVESVKGVGSRFFFEIKLQAAKYDDLVRPLSFDKMQLKNLRGYVLIAEDNRVNQKVATEMVSYLGCRCRVVENGEEALAALQAEHFDLVLMDGQMPVMDGYDATRLIREGRAGERNQNIPILATTANAIKGDIERCLEVGMNDYISKPISYDDLAFKVEKWMLRGRNVIDEKAIQKIQQLSEKSGRPLLRELIDLYRVEAPKALTEMRERLEKRDFTGLVSIAHSQKSSAANLGALRLRELAERIEHSRSDSGENQVSMLVDSFERELKLVLADLIERSNEYR